MAVAPADVGEELDSLRLDVRKQIRRIEDEDEEPTLREGRRMTVRELRAAFREEYLATRSAKRSPRTLKYYDYCGNAAFHLPWRHRGAGPGHPRESHPSRSLRALSASGNPGVEGGTGPILRDVQLPPLPELGWARGGARGRVELVHVLDRFHLPFNLAVSLAPQGEGRGPHVEYDSRFFSRADMAAALDAYLLRLGELTRVKGTV